MPIEMTDLALELRIPEDVVGGCLGLGERVRVVGHAEKAEPGDDREQLPIGPIAGKLLELGEERVEWIVVRVELLEIAGRVQRLDVFGVRQDDVESAGGDWEIRANMLSPPV